MSKIKKMTPMMRQYFEIKEKYPNVLLLYRMGDFYETFNEDAKIISKVLGIALTSRGGEDSTPLAGFPHHALDAHLPKLLKAGHKVARCEQIEDPKTAKGIVRRDVVEVVSPGSTLSEKLLDHKSNNYILAALKQKNTIHFAVADISTGEFLVSSISENLFLEQLLSYNPKEILLANSQQDEIKALLRNQFNGLYSAEESWFFDHTFAYDQLKNHFKIKSLKGFDIEDDEGKTSVAGALIHYLRSNYKSDLQHIIGVRKIDSGNFMTLDYATKRNLEIVESIQDRSTNGTLIEILDKTKTPMGARKLKSWIASPLINKTKIEKRHDYLSSLFEKREFLEEIRKILSDIGDLERVLGRVATGRGTPRDLLFLLKGLKSISPIQTALNSYDKELWKEISDAFENVDKIILEIEHSIDPDAPNSLTEGNIIKKGFNEELDELKKIAFDGKSYIAALQNTEREKTGIASLKVKFNKVFGYYIEVTNTHKDKVPENYIRKQTLVNAERYITDELKKFEEKILGAEEKINKLEYELFQKIRTLVALETKAIQKNSEIISEIDIYQSFATVSKENRYFRPEMLENGELYFEEGRHPVIEQLLDPGTKFVSNDCAMNLDSDQIMLITGPNMAGKSTYLRQTGLIVLMAQIGCFVPAQNTKISVVDRIFTRVGASDNLASGESTFMVEMNEAANILNNATQNSLILLDELGRGTSTFDGLSIAWAVAEYIHNNSSKAAKTLFATHYHELTELEIICPRVKNFNIAVEEYEDQIIFLRKIVRGGTDNSYGIQVAKMAGLPNDLIDRAKEILENLEANELNPNTKQPLLATKRKKQKNHDQNQVDLFSMPKISMIEERIKEIDLNNMTPLEAMNELSKLKKLL
jgi:DNA mismatch repair protein MutS